MDKSTFWEELGVPQDKIAPCKAMMALPVPDWPKDAILLYGQLAQYPNLEETQVRCAVIIHKILGQMPKWFDIHQSIATG